MDSDTLDYTHSDIQWFFFLLRVTVVEASSVRRMGNTQSMVYPASLDIFAL